MPRACAECKSSHISCDMGRPCNRCFTRNFQCFDPEIKKRGPKFRKIQREIPPESSSSSTFNLPSPPSDISFSSSPIKGDESLHNDGIEQSSLNQQKSEGLLLVGGIEGDLNVNSSPFSSSNTLFHSFDSNASPEGLYSEGFVDPQQNFSTSGEGLNSYLENYLESYQRMGDLINSSGSNALIKKESPLPYVITEEYNEFLLEELKKMGLHSEHDDAVTYLRKFVAKTEPVVKFLSQEQIKQLRSEYEKLLDKLCSSADDSDFPVIVLIRAAAIHHVNPAFREFTGWKGNVPTAAEEGAFVQFFDQQSIRFIHKEFPHIILSNKKRVVMDIEIMSKGGGKVPGKFSVSIKRDIFGLPQVYYGHFTPNSLESDDE